MCNIVLSFCCSSVKISFAWLRWKSKCTTVFTSPGDTIKLWIPTKTKQLAVHCHCQLPPSDTDFARHCNTTLSLPSCAGYPSSTLQGTLICSAIFSCWTLEYSRNQPLVFIVLPFDMATWLTLLRILNRFTKLSPIPPKKYMRNRFTELPEQAVCILIGPEQQHRELSVLEKTFLD